MVAESSEEPPLEAAEASSKEERSLAILCEALFLINLMLLPVIAFAVLLYLYFKHAKTDSALVKNHLYQTVHISVIGGTLLFVFLGAIALFGGLSNAYTWVAIVLYFTLVHTSLIFCGVIGFSRALEGKPAVYPFIGKYLMREHV